MNRARAISWLFGLAAFLVAAGLPAVASAHIGHHHHGQSVQKAVHQVQENTASGDMIADSAPAFSNSGSVLSAADGDSGNPDCGSRGCCNSCHCTSYVAMSAPFAGAAWPLVGSVAYGRWAVSGIVNAHADRLKRPPRFLS